MSSSLLPPLTAIAVVRTMAGIGGQAMTNDGNYSENEI